MLHTLLNVPIKVFSIRGDLRLVEIYQHAEVGIILSSGEAADTN